MAFMVLLTIAQDDSTQFLVQRNIQVVGASPPVRIRQKVYAGVWQ